MGAGPPGWNQRWSRSRVAPAGRGGSVFLAAFFGFGALVSLLTAAMLLAPGRWADAIWSLKPSARIDFGLLDGWAVPLMLLVSAACAGTALGVWRGRRWGYRLAIGILTVNLAGDLSNGVLRDPRTLIGIPIGGAIILYAISRERALRGD
jgi:hypothetical protein